MYLLKKLSWFFKLEWKRYAIGILALSLVSVLNLIPPRVIGEVVDAIELIAVTPFSSSHVWPSFCMETLHFWDCKLARTKTSQSSIRALHKDVSKFLSKVPFWRFNGSCHQ